MNHADTIRSHSSALDPVPTKEAPRLTRIPGIRSVVFDIYGTLFISAAGDISLADDSGRDDLLRDAIEAGTGRSLAKGVDGLAERYLQEVKRHQDRRRKEGVTYPEVEIRAVWQDVLDSLVAGGDLPEDAPRTEATCETIAVAYECAVNPVWPMPNLDRTLRELRERDLPLGIVSNAQFYTLSLFPAFLENRDRKELGFVPSLEVFSFQEQEGKPSRRLYDILAERLAEIDLLPAEVLYVGNDLRNDIWPAQEVGFQTALFAGDERSLRWRRDDPRVADVSPDLILTDLSQVIEVLT